MSRSTLALPIEGVWIGHLTDESVHPLDRWTAGIRHRSNEAFRHVYEATVDDLVSFAFGMVGDRRTAEDIVQDAFIELVRASSKLKGDGRSLKAWLFRSVRYGCLDEYRRRSRRPEVLTERVPETPAESEEPRWLDPGLQAALSQLSAKQRSLVLMRHVVGLSGDEVAAATGMSRKAVYAATDRAEAKLRDAMEGQS